MKTFLLFLLFFSVIHSVGFAEDVKLPPKEKLYLFLLAGQSNMSGRGKPDAASKLIDPHIIAFDKQGEWKIATELPFIIGQLGRFPAKPWNEDHEAVDAAQRAVAKRLKNVAFVPIDDPVSIGDNLHFNTPTLRRFAEGYAKAYLEMTFTSVRQIDEMGVFDEALDAAAVGRIYQSNDGGVTPSTATRLRVHLFRGQSNGDGRVAPGELPVDLQSPQSNVELYYKAEGSSVSLNSLRPGLTGTLQFWPEITLEGMAWMQGEADASVEHAALYQSRLP